MNAKVLYESRYGNTKRLAEAIARSLEASGTVELAELGSDANFQVDTAALLVVGAPTEGHGMSQALRAAMARVPADSVRGVRLAVFDTRLRWPLILSGSAARGIAAALEAKGARLAVAPESFFVKGKPAGLLEGEIERAAAWANKLAVTPVSPTRS